MKRSLVLGIIGLLLSAAACAGGPSGPQTYTVGVDAASAEGKNFQYSTFFPSTIKASPGDSIEFQNASTQAPHTISFGIASDRSNQPRVVLPTGEENPVVQQACFGEDPPTPDLSTCPHKELPAYGGTGYWNSGFLNPAPAPAQAGPKELTVELADSIAPGKYTYLCLLHAPMIGVVEVVDDEGDRASTADVVKMGDEQLKKVKADANAIADPEIKPGQVAAGWSASVTAVNRFLPDTIEVRAGQSVMWEAHSAYEPHTVSFGAGYQAGAPAPGQTAPQGAKSGSAYTGGDANSGIFGIKGGPFPPGPFTLTFPTAGEYKYVCVLHPGMMGTVRVT